MHKNIVRPGTDNQPSGYYKEVDCEGREIQNARHCTIEQGDRLPPTQAKGNCWIKID